MPEYNDFSDLDLTSQDAMSERMESTEEVLDPIALSTAVLVVCDYLDIDPLETVKCLIPGNPPPPADSNIGRAESRLIRDLLDCSQSNYDRSLHALLEVLTLDQKIGDLA